MVGGEELPEDKTASKATDKDKDSTGKGQQPKKEDPAPATPTINLSPIDSFNMGTVGNNVTRDVSVTPVDARITVSSNNNGVVSVAVSDRRITVTSKAFGSATITVKAEKSGYNTATRQFTVTVNPIISFQSLGPQDGAPVFSNERVVIVEIYNPEIYCVYIKGHSEPLKYRPDLGTGVFRGVVPENLARRENVIVK